MDKGYCMDRVSEMMDLLKVRVMEEASRLYSSGAVDTSRFNNDYRLACILMSVAVRNSEYVYKRTSISDMPIVRNLEKF